MRQSSGRKNFVVLGLNQQPAQARNVSSKQSKTRDKFPAHNEISFQKLAHFTMPSDISFSKSTAPNPRKKCRNNVQQQVPQVRLFFSFFFIISACILHRDTRNTRKQYFLSSSQKIWKQIEHKSPFLERPLTAFLPRQWRLPLTPECQLRLQDAASLVSIKSKKIFPFFVFFFQ